MTDALASNACAVPADAAVDDVVEAPPRNRSVDDRHGTAA
jgi:hypothetical protein